MHLPLQSRLKAFCGSIALEWNFVLNNDILIFGMLNMNIIIYTRLHPINSLHISNQPKLHDGGSGFRLYDGSEVKL